MWRIIDDRAPRGKAHAEPGGERAPGVLPRRRDYTGTLPLRSKLFLPFRSSDVKGQEDQVAPTLVAVAADYNRYLSKSTFFLPPLLYFSHS
jgi:hypothetical protein